MGPRRFTDPTTLNEIGQLVSFLVAWVAQRPSWRFAAITRLARDASVEQGPLAGHIAAHDEAWLQR